jgi:hypothetical protein
LVNCAAFGYAAAMCEPQWVTLPPCLTTTNKHSCVLPMHIA